MDGRPGEINNAVNQSKKVKLLTNNNEWESGVNNILYLI